MPTLCVICTHPDADLVKMQMKKLDGQVITVRSAALILGVSEDSVWRHRQVNHGLNLQKLKRPAPPLIVASDKLTVDDYRPTIHKIMHKLTNWIEVFDEAVVGGPEAKIVTSLSKEFRGYINDLSKLELAQKGLEIDKSRQNEIYISEMTEFMATEACEVCQAKYLQKAKEKWEYLKSLNKGEIIDI